MDKLTAFRQRNAVRIATHATLCLLWRVVWMTAFLFGIIMLGVTAGHTADAKDVSAQTAEGQPRLDFSRSCCPLPQERVNDAVSKATARAQRLISAANYIESVSRHECDPVESAIVFEQGTSGHPGWYLPLALALARFESHHALHPSGYYTGPLQLDPGRLRSMREQGLDPADPAAQITYFCRYVSNRLAEGKSLRQALRPWSPRDRALVEFKKIRGGFEVSE